MSSQNPHSPLLHSLLLPTLLVLKMALTGIPLVLTHLFQAAMSVEDLGMDSHLGQKEPVAG